MTKCGHCGFDIHPSEHRRSFGFYIAHQEHRCRELLLTEISRLKSEVEDLRAENARMRPLFAPAGTVDCSPDEGLLSIHYDDDGDAQKAFDALGAVWDA
jgi:hypothetical protein